jgi:hypothetical protein
MATAFWLVVTLALAAVWVYSHRSPSAWQRTRWELTAATDEWWDIHLLLADGTAAAAFTHQTAPAFVGQVVGAGGAIAPDRVEPAGVAWSAFPTSFPLLIRDDAPRSLSRLGVSWETEQPLPGSSSMFPGERWGVQLRLALPTMIAGTMTILAAALAHRAALPWRRSHRGLCAACGYDLRGSAGQCPECGTERT